jgi:hypothetical protein
MRKYFLLLIPLLTGGCEKDFDNVIDVSTDNYQVISVVISTPTGVKDTTGKDTIDLKEPSDSLLNLKITFSQGSQVRKVYFYIQASDNSYLSSSPVEMTNTGSNIFESQFILRNNNPNGNYNIKFSVTGSSGINKQAAVANFYFNNGQDNVPPVISNTIIEPDTVIVTEPTLIFTSVDVIDTNGLNDIAEVYFIVYRPNGTSNNIKTFLLDDGSCCPIPPANLTSGDIAAGDGTFSRVIQVDENNAKGTYRFEFHAMDRLGELSNILNHFVLIQ